MLALLSCLKCPGNPILCTNNLKAECHAITAMHDTNSYTTAMTFLQQKCLLVQDDNEANGISKSDLDLAVEKQNTKIAGFDINKNMCFYVFTHLHAHGCEP